MRSGEIFEFENVNLKMCKKLKNSKVEEFANNI